jgi:YgiT-type zinc finger domain-containing protein
MKKFCDECGREVDTRIITKKESYDVCGERIEVDAKVLVCADCGEEFFCEELDNATLTEAYNIYRRNQSN